MNWLDILAGKGNQRYNGRYYKELPENRTISAPPELFSYEFADVRTREYKSLLGNLIDTDSATLTISTRSSVKFQVNSHIALQDGFLYLITSVTENPNSVSQDAARFSIFPKGIEKVIRLIQVEDIWKIGGARVE